mmetsp:Transcript_63820/g.125654  ORF Transcript_63820/g.125654 Transcript_63820/m.125654 type:complete len:208 (-) Transcript_63820:463-1086(-)
MQEIRRRTFSSNQRNVLLQCLRIEEVHIIFPVRFSVSSREGVVVPPVEVVGLSALTTHHQWMLTNILIHRSGATFLCSNNNKTGYFSAQVFIVCFPCQVNASSSLMYHLSGTKLKSLLNRMVIYIIKNQMNSMGGRHSIMNAMLRLVVQFYDAAFIKLILFHFLWNRADLEFNILACFDRQMATMCVFHPISSVMVHRNAHSRWDTG